MPNPDRIVRAFIQNMNIDPDPNRLSEYFAEDAVYHNTLEPVVGRTAIRDTFVGFLPKFDSIHWEIHHQIASGNVVMNERTDMFSSGGRATPIRVMGVFEVADGLITAWRDYFDPAELAPAFGQ